MIVDTDYFLLKAYPQLLLIRSYSWWDDRVARSFVKAIREVVLDHYDGPWAVLHDARKWELGIPEAEEVIGEVLVNRITNAMTHHAFVSGPSELKKWQIARIFRQTQGFQHAIFEDLEAARAWLASSGYEIPGDELD